MKTKCFLKLTAVLFLTSTLWACSSIKPPPDIKTPDMLEKKPTQVEDVNHWNLKGIVGVQEANEAWSASIAWTQASSQYYVRLYGPVGIGTVIIEGKPGYAKLTTSKNETFTASSPEALLKEQTGLYLPVSSLRYWIRGLAIPGINAQKSYDSSKRLSSLKQQGWLIQYQRYTQVRGMNLPSKITLTNEKIKVKMVINSWKV